MELIKTAVFLLYFFFDSIFGKGPQEEHKTPFIRKVLASKWMRMLLVVIVLASFIINYKLLQRSYQLAAQQIALREQIRKLELVVKEKPKPLACDPPQVPKPPALTEPVEKRQKRANKHRPMTTDEINKELRRLENAYRQTQPGDTSWLNEW